MADFPWKSIGTRILIAIANIVLAIIGWLLTPVMVFAACLDDRHPDSEWLRDLMTGERGAWE